MRVNARKPPCDPDIIRGSSLLRSVAIATLLNRKGQCLKHIGKMLDACGGLSERLG